ncbi:MAG: sigma-70 family RNA polymerase sigma factor [Pseudomonadota bacterium]
MPGIRRKNSSEFSKEDRNNAANELANESNISDNKDISSTKLVDFYRGYFGELAKTLRSMFGDGPPDPDDVAQEAFHRLMQRGDYASIKNLKAFVWRTARNILVTEKRHVAMRSRHDYEIEQFFFTIAGYDSSSEKVIEAREQLKLINDAIMKMPAMRRRAFVLNRIESLSVAEVGRQLGISRPGASKHIARATADIEAALGLYTEE